MPRFFFDIQNGDFIRDVEGRECDDFDAARALALRTLPEIAQWAAPTRGDKQNYLLFIRDQANQLVYTVSLTIDGWRINETNTKN